MAIAAGLMWAALRPLHEDQPAPYTYDEWNRVMTAVYLLFFGATAGLRHALAPHVGRVGQIGLVVSMVGSALLVVGNVVEFWVSLVLDVPTAFDAGYIGAGWPGSYTGWGIFMAGCLTLLAADGLLVVALIRVAAVRWWLTLPVVLSQLFMLAFFAPRQSLAFGAVWVVLGLALAAFGMELRLRGGQLTVDKRQRSHD
jgi:hypothetical protein